MTTLLKIRGLDRVSSTNVGSTGAPDSLVHRGFRVNSGYGLFYDAGQGAFEIVGTGNAAVQYTAVKNGTFANGFSVVQNAPSGSTRIITTTYAAGTGLPVVTITPTSTDTAATLAAAVNADPQASSYVIASYGGTGASAPVASSNANEVITITASGTPSAGTFTLTFPGFGTTGTIAYNAAGSVVATAVQTLTGGTVTGSGTTLPTTTTLTFSGSLANTPIANPSVNNGGLTGGTYSTAITTPGTASAGTLAGGTNVISNLSPGYPFQVLVNNQRVAVVDLDDAKTNRQLYRVKGRWVSLGQP